MINVGKFANSPNKKISGKWLKLILTESANGISIIKANVTANVLLKKGETEDSPFLIKVWPRPQTSAAAIAGKNQFMIEY